MAFTKDRVRDIQASLDMALANWAKESGLEAKTVGGTYDPATGVTFKVAVKDAGSLSREEIDLDQHETFLGLGTGLRGKTFSYGGSTHTLWGYNYKARSMPLLTKWTDASGKARTSKWAVEAVRHYLGLPPRQIGAVQG